MKRFILCCCVQWLMVAATGQHLPNDYLPASFHAARRAALRERMPPKSVAVIFAYPERVFSRDVQYAYHPNPDLYYFSGYKEPNAVLFIFKEQQQIQGQRCNELFFVRKRNPLQEQWTGRRLGVEGVQQQLGFSQVYNDETFEPFPLDLTQFDRVLYDALPDDVGSGMLQQLIQSFKKKAKIEQVVSSSVLDEYNILLQYTNASNVRNRAARIQSRMVESNDPRYKQDPWLQELVGQPDSATLARVQDKIRKEGPVNLAYHELVSSLREIKTPEELQLLRKSVFYSAIAHVEIMKAIEPEMSETELQGLFMYIHKKYGAEDEGYPPIVGAGANGCILHYIENNVTQVSNQLVLMDVASEYHGYSADITRTVPANGKFTPAQKAIYELVYEAQEAVFAIAREGTPFKDLNIKSKEVLAAGLMRLGIIQEAEDVSRYYPHGCSHHLGLDVHDKFVSPILKENMVITVEPGIYIPKGSPCDPKWWDIAVRIEDDILILKNGYESLSIAAPRKLAEVEKMVAQKSVFSELNLPEFRK